MVSSCRDSQSKSSSEQVALEGRHGSRQIRAHNATDLRRASFLRVSDTPVIDEPPCCMDPTSASLAAGHNYKSIGNILSKG
jgi:hypothetical protein